VTDHTPVAASEVIIRVRRAPAGGWLLTVPDVPDFRRTARNPPDLARAVAAAWQAVSTTPPTPVTSLPPVADLMLTTGYSRAEVNGGLRRKHDPAAWRPLPGGTWLSPGGKVYQASSGVARRIIATRRTLGLPVEHDTDGTLDVDAR